VSRCCSLAPRLLTDHHAGIDYPIDDITFGTDQEFPIPGFSIDIPVVGSAGVFAAVDVSGDVSSFQAKLGLDACIDSIIGEECGSSLTSELPVYVLQGTFSFDSICNGTVAART
jgi:hypothetical protein